MLLRRKIAYLRIHIERTIRRVKEFDIVTGVMPASPAGSANQIWTVCALLTNLQSPVLSCKHDYDCSRGHNLHVVHYIQR